MRDSGNEEKLEFSHGTFDRKLINEIEFIPCPCQILQIQTYDTKRMIYKKRKLK